MPGTAKMTQEATKTKTTRTASKVKRTAPSPTPKRGTGRRRPAAANAVPPARPAVGESRPRNRPEAATERPRTDAKAPSSHRRQPKGAPRPQPDGSKPPAEGTSPPPATETPPLTRAQVLAQIVQLANAGSQPHLDELRKILDKYPSIWRVTGDVAALTESAWVRLLAAGNSLAAEAIPRRLKELKAELADVQATPLEKLVVNYLIVAWLAAQHGESAAAEVGGSLEQARFRLARAESAGRRLGSAVKMLTLIRALAPRGLLPPPPTEATEARGAAKENQQP